MHRKAHHGDGQVHRRSWRRAGVSRSLIDLVLENVEGRKHAAGTFSTNDGRGPFFNVDPEGVVARTRAAMRGGLVINADHATDRAAPQGLPAPAMGWIRDFRVVVGAIGGQIQWTERGAAAVKAKEYRFVSPVFSFDPPAGRDESARTGRIKQILRAALTNNPALSQLPAIAASHRVDLSAMEKKTCADLGNSESDYAASKARRQSLVRPGV